MKAPEKLYLSKNIYSTFVYQTPNPEDETEVEYTCTNAFIDKACKWLKENIENYYYLDEAYDQVISIKRILEDFPKAMEE